MSNYKVCVYAICKNEEQFVDRWMASVREADLVVVTDTGSDDDTVKKLRAAGAVVYEERIDPWRFDTARNLAMDHIPEDVDICVSNDLDEVFLPGWRQKLEAAWDGSCTRARYLFTWSYHADGTPNKQFAMEKIHRRHGFRWVHPVHEVLEYSGEDGEKTVWVEGLVLNHYPDLSKPRTQYLPLLELSARENPQDNRTAFWLGREYYYHKEYAQAIATLKQYLKMPSATWAEERSAAMRFIGLSYEGLDNQKETKAWFFRALAECPHLREPYVKLAKIGYTESDWPMTYAMAQKGLAVTNKTGSYLVEPESWGYVLYDLGAIGAYRLGLYTESLAYAKNALELDGSVPRLKTNLALIEAKVNELEGWDEV